MSLALKQEREQTEAKLRSIADALDAGTATDEQRADAPKLVEQLTDISARESIVDAAALLRKANPDVDIVDDEQIRQVALGGGSRLVAKPISPYGSDSPNSYFRDRFAVENVNVPQQEREAARERIVAQHEHDGDERGVVTARALATGTSGSGAEIVVPAYLQSEMIDLIFGTYASTSLVTRIPVDVDPLAHTTSVRVPKVATGFDLTDHVENAGVEDEEPTLENVRVDIDRGAASTKVPNFLLQRSLPGVDSIIVKLMARAAARDLNAHVLTKSKTNSKGFLAESGLGASTTTTATPTVSTIYQGILGALEDVLTGMDEPAEALVTNARVWFWLLGQLDNQTHPYAGIKVAEPAIGVNGAPNTSKPVGYVLGTPLYIDQMVPTNLGDGTNESRIIASKFSESWLLHGMPRVAVSEHANFGSDQTTFRVTQDRGFTCARHKGATSIVAGTGLAL
jgi:HK97 family phage major capsid protein